MIFCVDPWSLDVHTWRLGQCSRHFYWAVLICHGEMGSLFRARCRWPCVWSESWSVTELFFFCLNCVCLFVLMNFGTEKIKMKTNKQKSSADAAFTHFMFCVRELIAFCMPVLSDYRYMNSGLLPCFQTTNLQAAGTCCSLGISHNQGDARFRAGRFTSNIYIRSTFHTSIFPFHFREGDTQGRSPRAILRIALLPCMQ